ncbi:ATP-binding protein [Streptomyces sp. NPDC001848]|uniref:ATP-binding protein n=1 Tax=Streptomyces sp. NPDC001848 TaxID=3364618 RepID=UPI0036CF9732
MKPVDLSSRDDGNRQATDERGTGAVVRRQHAHPPDGVRQSDPSSPGGPVTSAATARARVLAVVRSHWEAAPVQPAEQAVTDLLLVTSELVSNAIRHGGGLVGFEAVPTREGVRLVVHDRSPDVPSVAFGTGELPNRHDRGGFGWPLIIKLARDIVIEPHADGKAVSVLVPLG